MAVTIILEVRAQKGTGSDFLCTMKEILPDTRNADGCLSVDVYQNQDDSDVVVLVENFETKEHYEKYLAWRVERGDVEKLTAALEGEPSIRYFDQRDV